ncbi:unnamed protein product [Natator depressus]
MSVFEKNRSYNCCTSQVPGTDRQPSCSSAHSPCPCQLSFLASGSWLRLQHPPLYRAQQEASMETESRGMLSLGAFIEKYSFAFPFYEDDIHLGLLSAWVGFFQDE